MPHPESVDLQVGAPTQLRLVMVRAGHIQLRVLDLQGSPIAAGQVRVLDSKGQSVGKTQSLLSVMSSLFRSRDAEGNSGWMDMGDLPPDTYRLEVTQKLEGGKTEVRSATRVLNEGEQAKWEVKLSDLVQQPAEGKQG